MSRKNTPNLFDTFFIILLSGGITLFVFFISTRILGLNLFEELPSWLTAIYQSIWSYIITTGGAILLWFLRRQQSKDEYPNYILWVSVCTILLFLLLLFSNYLLKPSKSSSETDLTIELIDSISGRPILKGEVEIKFDGYKMKLGEQISQGLVSFTVSNEELSSKLRIWIRIPKYAEIKVDTIFQKKIQLKISNNKIKNQPEQLSVRSQVSQLLVYCNNKRLVEEIERNFPRAKFVSLDNALYKIIVAAEPSALDYSKEYDGYRYDNGGRLIVKVNDTEVYSSTLEIQQSSGIYMSKSKLDTYIEGELNKIVEFEGQNMLLKLQNKLK